MGGDAESPPHATGPADDEVYEWPWPTGPGADFVLGKQEELAGLLATRRPVFLDTNFWVMARQAALAESDDPELISLLGALRMAVGSGKAFFPVTSDLIEEFSKQSPERLQGTLMMVDALNLPHCHLIVPARFLNSHGFGAAATALCSDPGNREAWQRWQQHLAEAIDR